MIYLHFAFIPETTNVSQIPSDLNCIERSIQFTVEEEQGSKLPFLDVLIHRHSERLKYALYRNPTNKEDLIHYLSAHSDRVKSAIVIGFYLRALRICSPDFIQEEIDHVVNTFIRLKFPLTLLLSLQKTARKIFQRAEATENRRSGTEQS